MNDAKGKTPQIVVVGSGPPKRPAEQIVASPMKMPKWLSIDPPKPAVVLGIKEVPSHGSCWQDARPRYQMTDSDWSRLLAASRLPDHHACVLCDDMIYAFAREINSTIFLAEESLRKAIASDLRSVGSSHPELAAWAETLACRYARGEEAA